MLDSRSAYVVNPSLLMNLSAGSPTGKQQMRELLEEYDSVLQGRIDSLKGLSQTETTLRSHIAFENDVYVKEKGITDPTTALSSAPKNAEEKMEEDNSDSEDGDGGSSGKIVRPARSASGSALKGSPRRSGSAHANGNFQDVSAQVRRMFRAVRLFERKRKLDRLSNIERTHNVSFAAAQTVGSLNALLEQFDRSSAVGSAFGSGSVFDSSIISPSEGESYSYDFEGGGVVLPYEQWSDEQIKEHLLSKLQAEESRNATLRAALREQLSKLSTKQANADRAAKVDPIESTERSHFDRLWTLSDRLKDLTKRFQGTSGVSAGNALNSLTVQMNEILRREEELRTVEMDRRRREWRTDYAAASVIASAGDSSSSLPNSFAGRSSSFLSRHSPNSDDVKLPKKRREGGKGTHDRTLSGGSDRDTTLGKSTSPPLGAVVQPPPSVAAAGPRMALLPALTPVSSRGDFALSGANSLRPDPSLSSGPSGTNFSFSASVTQRGSFNTSLLLQPGSPFLVLPQGDFQSQASGTFRLQNQSSLGTLTSSFGAPTVSSIGKYTPGLVFTAAAAGPPVAVEKVQSHDGHLHQQAGLGAASVSRSPSREGAGSSSSDTPRGDGGPMEATAPASSRRKASSSPSMKLGLPNRNSDPTNTTSSSSGKEGMTTTGHSSSSATPIGDHRRSDLMNRQQREAQGPRPMHRRAASDDNIHHRIDEDMRRDADRMAMEVCVSQITAEWRKASQLRHQLVLMTSQMRSLELQMTIRIPDHLNARRTEVLHLEGVEAPTLGAAAGQGGGGVGIGLKSSPNSKATRKSSSFLSPKRLQWSGKHSFAASISDVVHCVSMVTELTDEQVQIKALQRQCRRRVRLLEGLLELRRTAELSRAVNVKLPLHL